MGHVACANNAWGNIAAAISVADTTIALTSGQGQRFPATDNGDWFYSTLIDPTGVLEIIKVTNRNTDILTVQRGVDGTTPHAFPAGAGIELRPVAAWFKDFMAAFMARDGQYPATANADMGAFRLTNVADPQVAQDAVTLGFLSARLPVGTGIMWWGDYAANKTAIEAAGWHLCDGTSGTPDMRGRFPRGATGLVSGDTGGADSITLDIAHIPGHTHGLVDPGHAHAVYDPGHAHGVIDNGHAHGLQAGGFAQAGQDNGSCSAASGPNQYGRYDGRNGGMQATNGSGAGIGIAGSGTGIGIYGNGTGISIQSTGGGQAFDNRPAFTGWHFLMRIA